MKYRRPETGRTGAVRSGRDRIKRKTTFHIENVQRIDIEIVRIVSDTEQTQSRETYKMLG